MSLHYQHIDEENKINIWVIEWAIMACMLVVPLALIAGHLRQVPIYWRLVDCSLGLFGLIPLILCHRDIRKLGKLSGSPS